MKKIISIAALATMVAASSGNAFATDPEGFKGEITPYLWYAGLEGDVTLNGRNVEFEKSAGDLFETVEAGGAVLAVFQYNRFMLWGQMDYFSLSTDELKVDDRPQGGSLDTKMLLGEVAVGYQINGWFEGMTIDLLAGVRSLTMESDLELFGRGTISRDNDLLDPIFVVRPSIPLFPSKVKGLRFNPTLAIGGGGDAELVYELFPQLQYQITNNIAARLGYRTVGYKFEKDDNELDFSLSGLIAGVGVTF